MNLDRKKKCLMWTPGIGDRGREWLERAAVPMTGSLVPDPFISGAAHALWTGLGFRMKRPTGKWSWIAGNGAFRLFHKPPHYLDIAKKFAVSD